ncbi:MAG: peptide chain release factor N(5)-glutamine methyltransferase, partial [bacterium]|nr:peptide chain release factor N(5)-glutamine methyltransferase [bacterium]
IAEEEKATMERNVLDFEPARALFVPNEDPLCFYRALARLGQHHLSEQGELYVEINARFGAETVALFEEEGYRKVTLLHDLYQQERFIKAYR